MGARWVAARVVGVSTTKRCEEGGGRGKEGE